MNNEQDHGLPKKNGDGPEEKPAASNKAGTEASHVKFKTYPFFQRKKPDSLKGIRQSRDNPLENIQTQHYQNRVRVLKIFLIIAVFVFVVAGGSLLYNEWKKDNRKKEIIAGYQAKLKEADMQLQSPDLHDKIRASVKAAKIAGVLTSYDIANRRKWAAERKKYYSLASETLAKEKITSGKNFISGATFSEMTFIPRGRFFMGKLSNEPGGKDYELPRRAISIPYDFWIGKTEITNEEFRTFFPHHNIEKWNSYALDSSSQPAVKVDWHLASGFCRMLTEHEKREGRLPEGYEYRLPTEAEWEYSCRGGTETVYYWGDSFGDTGAKFANSLDKYSADTFNWRGGYDMARNDGFRVSAPVASYGANSFGLYDMTGNVWEWCYDWYNPDAYKELPDEMPVQTKPVVASIKKAKPFDSGYYYIESTCKVIRGGSWGNLPALCRSAARDYTVPEDKNTGIGFRIVLAPVIKQE